MNVLSVCAQIFVAVTILIVWIWRFDNIVVEFKKYGIPDVLRNLVGATKIVLSTFLILGIWYPQFVAIPAILMGVLMLGAQYEHFKVKNPWKKHLPSFILLVLSVFMAIVNFKYISL